MSVREDINKVEKKIKKIEEQSLAMELLKDARKTNKRLFIIWILTFIAFIGLLGYTIWLLNDIGTINETTTSTQEKQALITQVFQKYVEGKEKQQVVINGNMQMTIIR